VHKHAKLSGLVEIAPLGILSVQTWGQGNVKTTCKCIFGRGRLVGYGVAGYGHGNNTQSGQGRVGFDARADRRGGSCVARNSGSWRLPRLPLPSARLDATAAASPCFLGLLPKSATFSMNTTWNALFSGIVVMGFLNGIAHRALAAVAADPTDAVLGGFGISLVVWAALAAGAGQTGPSLGGIRRSRPWRS
jgi:hypothetical protein